MNGAFTAKAGAALVTSHRHYASADLLQNGIVVRTGILLDEDSGPSVSVDGSRAVRRTFSGSLIDPLSYLPLTPASLLSPFLTEIRVWSGIIYPDGSLDRWTVFTGGIEDPKVTDTDADLTIEITASDRAQAISDRRLAAPYVIAAGTPVVDAIKALLRFVMPGLTDASFSVATPTANPALPAMVIDELEDAWQHAQDMANAYGLECFFDAAGLCVIRPVSDPESQSPVWSFAEGASAIVTEIDATLTAKDSYSHAIVTGAELGGAAPVRWDTYDDDPASYTYYRGGFGDRPVKLASDLITTQPQAAAAAAALLARKKGAVQNVSFTHVPLTALDEHDVVYISRARLGMANVFSLESFTIPLDPTGTMNPTCRSRRI